jgi:hypothetical protein
MNKAYFNWIIDHFEADMYETTEEAFDKRSSITNKGGRPYLYSPREIGEIMVKYFRNCIKYDQPFTITGLCFHLGMDRRSLLRLEKSSKQEFSPMIKKGKDMIMTYLEMQLHLAPNPAFAIFVLKNMGWCDKWTAQASINRTLSNKERIEAQIRINNISEKI